MKTEIEEKKMPKPKRTRYSKKKQQKSFYYSKMDEFVKNQGLQHVSTFIFHCLDTKTLLNCREVGKAWRNNVLGNPKFWLKKCIENGMPLVHQSEWIQLIEHFEGIDFEGKLTLFLIKTITGVNQEKHYKFRGQYQSPVNLACKYGDIEILKALEIRKSLKDAIKHADSEAQGIIIQQMKWANRTEQDEPYLPFHIAAENGHLEIVKMLSNYYIHDYIDANILGTTSLHYATAACHLDVMEFLIPICWKEADQFWGDNFRISVHHRAAKYGNPEVLKFLFDASEEKDSIIYDLNSTTDMGTSLIHEACKSGKLENVQLVVETVDNLSYMITMYNEKRPKLNDLDNNDDTPIHIAAQNGNHDIVEYLVKKGVDPWIRGSRDDNAYPLNNAISYDGKFNPKLWNRKNTITYSEGHLKTIRYLVGQPLKTKPHKRDFKNMYYNATRATNGLEVIKLLKSIVPWSTEYLGYLIMLASRYNNLEMIKLLLSFKREPPIDFHLLTLNGIYPFHSAAANGHIEVVKYLSQLSGNPNAGDWKGNTPIHYALMTGDLDEFSKMSRPLHLTKGHIEVVKYLASLSEDPNIANKKGVTPVHLASLSDNGKEVLPFIIKSKFWKL